MTVGMCREQCAKYRGGAGGGRAQMPPDEPMRPPIKPESKFNGVSYFFQNAKKIYIYIIFTNSH